MKIWTLIGIVGMALVVGGCTPMFMVSKGEKRGVYLGSDSKATHEVLCASGELKAVLEVTHFSQEMKDTFYQYNCSAERSSDKVKQMFKSMTTEQKKDIKAAFKEKGYAINGGTC